MEMNALLEATCEAYPDDSLRAKRDTVILGLGLLAGLRVSEIVGLETDDVSAKSLVVRGKGGKQRKIPVGALLSPILRDWLEVRYV